MRSPAYAWLSPLILPTTIQLPCPVCPTSESVWALLPLGSFFLSKCQDFFFPLNLLLSLQGSSVKFLKLGSFLSLELHCHIFKRPSFDPNKYSILSVPSLILPQSLIILFIYLLICKTTTCATRNNLHRVGNLIALLTPTVPASSSVQYMAITQ